MYSSLPLIMIYCSYSHIIFQMEDLKLPVINIVKIVYDHGNILMIKAVQFLQIYKISINISN